MLKAVNLKTEYLKNPLGIDIEKPRFGWNLQGDGKRQTAFEIRAAHSEADLAVGNYVWQSGIVRSESMLHHPYGGTLKSRERVYWQVRVWDEETVKGEMKPQGSEADGKQDEVADGCESAAKAWESAGDWSEPAWFETGLLKESDWSAKWISGDYEPERGVHYPADYFRKVFPGGDVRAARMYITSCGVYEVVLNGKRVGDQVLAPGSTTYETRMQYQVYDVTELLREGDNEWLITLGDGWFRGNLGVMDENYVFGEHTAVFAQLEWEDGQGVRHVVATDGSFTWSNDGPVYYTDIKGGERVDASKEPSFQGHAKEVEWKTKLCCSNNVRVTEHERFKPTLLRTPNGQTVLDFGQNIAGYVEFFVSGEKGREVRLTMGEKLDENGNFTLDNLLQRLTFQEDSRDFDKFQKIVYRCAGKGREYWKPKFCFQGFRYVLVENWPGEGEAAAASGWDTGCRDSGQTSAAWPSDSSFAGINPQDFTAIAVYSDMEVCAKFHSSSKDLNQIVENTLWSMKGNFLDVPTDCPTRERAGWTGDAQLFFNAGCYFMDFSAFFRKWIRDLYDDQAKDGKIYNIVPRCGAHGGPNAHVEGSAGWTDAGILIPYRYWKHYFDKEMLENYYELMKRLMEFLLSRRGVEGDPQLDKKLPPGEWRKYMVTSGFHFGEWTEPGVDTVAALADTCEEATAYLVYTLRVMAEIAECLGKADDTVLYRTYAEESNAAYCHYYLKDKHVESGRMCKYVRPLALELLEHDGEMKKNVQDGLVELVRKNNHHVGTGFLSTPFLLDELTKAGYLEDAYQMLLQEEYPSWVYEIRKGATTIWENWSDDASLNHYSKGAICDWVFGTVCGVNIAGENEFRITPRPGKMLDYADFAYESPFGRVTSRWNKTGEGVRYQVEIPAGCHATVELPDGRKERICGGAMVTYDSRRK